MKNHNLEHFTSYINEDNRISNLIYQELMLSLNQSLKQYPLEVNLIGIFFFDFLKFITGMALRKREIQHSLLLSKGHNTHRLKKWPYVSYEDLKSGFKKEDKEYGKKVQYPHVNFLKKTVAFSSQVFSTNKRNIILAGSCIDKEISLKSCLSGIGIDWFTQNDWHPCIPDIDKQLTFLTNLIEMLVTKIDIGIDVETCLYMMDHHIRNSVRESDPLKLKIPPFLILGSGCEFRYRALAASARFSNVHVINITHGDSYGIVDNPAFGVGERLLSHACVGYGNEFNNSPHEYNYNNIGNSKYIPSSSAFIKSIYKKKYSIKTSNYFYFPTSLRGPNYRYGPYQDMADLHYLEWQKYLVSLFNSNLIIKAHPKDNFLYLLKEFHLEFITTNLTQMYRDVNVFVFDYMSTAFVYAAATTRPIIYFDLGIQNFTHNALKAIKERSIYYKVDKNFKVNLEAINHDIKNKIINHDIIEKYCLTKDHISREDAVIQYIKGVA